MNTWGSEPLVDRNGLILLPWLCDDSWQGPVDWKCGLGVVQRFGCARWLLQTMLILYNNYSTGFYNSETSIVLPVSIWIAHLWKIRKREGGERERVCKRRPEIDEIPETWDKGNASHKLFLSKTKTQHKCGNNGIMESTNNNNNFKR